MTKLTVPAFKSIGQGKGSSRSTWRCGSKRIRNRLFTGKDRVVVLTLLWYDAFMRVADQDTDFLFTFHIVCRLPGALGSAEEIIANTSLPTTNLITILHSRMEEERNQRENLSGTKSDFRGWDVGQEYLGIVKKGQEPITL